MLKVRNPQATEPTTILLEGVYLDSAERRLREALAGVNKHHKRQAKELCYLVYEALAREKFGTGNSRYDIAITCNEVEFVVSVKGA